MSKIRILPRGVHCLYVVTQTAYKTHEKELKSEKNAHILVNDAEPISQLIIISTHSLLTPTPFSIHDGDDLMFNWHCLHTNR